MSSFLGLLAVLLSARVERVRSDSHAYLWGDGVHIRGDVSNADGPRIVTGLRGRSG
ncbi:hypothetical protein SSPO_005890 [Streptomyces antimycoticus]|uniref:Uncharacterized protein n=1 Tax=Streptomyces antimycoticus TaxID=68175 RepID=A0A499UL60_9ACTN|nr:hypothetical protein SSPO_005890 [Streptomyces antimycoticus]